MNARSKFAGFLLSSILLFSLAWTASPPPLVAQDIVVSSGIPDNAPQGTINLNVRVLGKGFKRGAVAKWFVTGTTNPGGVTVNSTAFVSSSELLANITVASDAQTEKKFDIEVMLTSGRTGKGIELFTVTIPDPAITYLETGTAFGGELMVMDADGANKRAVLPGLNVMAYTPSWSPDGSQLVFGSDYQGNGVYVVGVDGTGLRKVVATNKHDIHAVWSPDLAPDGQYKIAFSDWDPGRQDNDLFLVNLDGTGLVNLTQTVGPGEFFPTWSPDGTRIAAKVYRGTSGPESDILVFHLGLDINGEVIITDTTNTTLPGPLKGANVTHPAWAKTQDKIAVVPSGGGISIIDLANLANPVNLNSRGEEPSWSPDDSQIVYRQRNASNKMGIFVINADGSGVHEIAPPTSKTRTPNWPDWRRCCPTCVTVCAP
jgi:hypothetical protein